MGVQKGCDGAAEICQGNTRHRSCIAGAASCMVRAEKAKAKNRKGKTKMKVPVRIRKRVKVHRVKRSAINKRRKLELIRMLDELDPDLYDDAKSHMRVLLAVK